ncbi:unnamed protein product [Echinostoma caproni]|uniref:DUF1996 domain-containing protein n=1 Tax=Echinostoma caproni TaxID=27848 RepID=A0A183A042_9TREM|nr:unnamed protein product [Echinostoma caproni]
MMTASLLLASNCSLHPSEVSDWYDQECSAAETSIQMRNYFHTSSVEYETPKQSQSWQIRDLDETDSPIDHDRVMDGRNFSSDYRSISKESSASIEPFINDQCWEKNTPKADQGLLRDSVIWAPPLKSDTAIILKRTLLRQSVSSGESVDSETRRTISQLKNYNATEDSCPSPIGTIYRRISHPDFEQKATHWVNVLFDFHVGNENRMHMKIRRDISFR